MKEEGEGEEGIEYGMIWREIMNTQSDTLLYVMHVLIHRARCTLHNQILFIWEGRKEGILFFFLRFT